MKIKHVLLITGLVTMSLSAIGFALNPISATVEPSGYGVSTNFRVENETSNRIAFQVSIVTREMDEFGKENTTPASNVFTVFPPQGILAAGKKQNVRVVWKGTASPSNELAYRIVAEELPVDFEQEKAQSHIKVLVKYMGTVYVRPKVCKPQIQVTHLTRATGENTTNAYEFAISNTGTAHQGLKNTRLTLTDAQGTKLELTGDKLEGVEGQNVLARHTRRFRVALPPDYKEPEYRAEIQVDE
jgi:fimbrial chaperone protein